MRYGELNLFELDKKAQSKLDFIQNKVAKGDIQDQKTIDFIFKILNKGDIKQTIDSMLTRVTDNDTDVEGFRRLNQGVLSKILRKMPVEKEELDSFLNKWAKGKKFVDTSKLVNGNKGSIQDLIPNKTAQIAFKTFEDVRSQFRMPKKGTTGYGEFGLAMLTTEIQMEAPGDVKINGVDVEVKGNDARLFADERAMAKTEDITEARGDAPGLINNAHASLQQNDANVENEVRKSFAVRGFDKGKIDKIIADAKKPGSSAFDTLGINWWRAGFDYYTKAIGMPILVLGFGQFLMSDKADDFISWGCLPKNQSNYGYLFGRQAGQSRETFPKIFVPGHNK